MSMALRGWDTRNWDSSQQYITDWRTLLMIALIIAIE
jgi:hypothetical protein